MISPMQVEPCIASTSRQPVSNSGIPDPNHSVHTSFSDNPLPIIENIHKRNMKAGVAISPDTPSTAITDEIADAADMLLVMMVYPGKNLIVT
jgi:hypothetical protein